MVAHTWNLRAFLAESGWLLWAESSLSYTVSETQARDTKWEPVSKGKRKTKEMKICELVN